ncbi:UDP-N-acetylmuramoyl-L-alanyl-D-glutamate--2,6-diaminopimelate ligase MurE homolog, chloroplastic isoform X2 [Abrus precatorius]|uniref:UDP-N-acetylmuramoyl-L-alanyl-D-glutamate--2, 6-diaminopimelate ligase MurE homolog, chloroplastic isoform X2 n=1 Tax=Abrus precatorius TaxID=3816 RepID=A0A8B8K8M9_ABRPR|nr:UDP-N-acetylmuramoyl-L-alanyl-D-glutamate--2,6-diaminopimelate ligase MurE homolog, chloroplastic isoform X2 [Abrus precatorius]
MALSYVSLPHLLCATTPSNPNSITVKFKHCRKALTSTSSPLFFRSIPNPFFNVRVPRAIGPDGKFYPSPADDDPPEAAEDSSHGFSTFQQIQRQADRARQLQEEDFKKNQSTYLAAIADVEDAPDGEAPDDSPAEDLFGEIDKAIALKRKEFVRQGLLEPNPRKEQQLSVAVGEDLQPEEVVDLEEIERLQGLTVLSDDIPGEFDDGGNGNGGMKPASPFEIDFESYGKSRARIVEARFRMSLAELLDESKVVPVSVYGDLEVEITGIQHDSRIVTAGDLFVCCVGQKTDGHLFLSEADKRGAVAVVASKEIDIEDTLGCKALVIVEDTNAVLPALAASFYKYPSKNMAVIGITGTYGKTTTTYLIKSMYEAMGLRTGMFNSVASYVHGDNKLDLPNMAPDAVLVQNLMAKMLHNGTEAVVMEAASHGLGQGKYEEVDFDIAIFTNLSQEGDGEAQAKLFSRMVDPERHRKVVNIDDPSAQLFMSQGNPGVPVVTFALENKNADVHPLKFELSLFETQVLVNTPTGILEISSGLLGKHNIYNILAAVAVGIAVGAPLEDIVRGIEEVDAVPGRCELIDEEQAFGVIVDYASSPDALSRLLDSVRELGPRRIITVDILDDMLAGVGWTMQDYLKYGENDYYPPLPNGNRLFLHDIRRVAVRAAVAMGEEGDVVVVAGKGHETYQIEGDKNDFFDDREECREALQYVDELHQAGIDTSEFPWRLPESH